MEDDRFWNHAGVSKIKDHDSKMVTIPPELFREKDILEEGANIRWYLNTETATAVITKNHLELDKYEEVGSTKLNTDGNLRCTVPAKFFEDYGGEEGQKVKPEFMQDVNWSKEGKLHFLYFDEMVDGLKQSCFVFTDEQFQERFGSPDISGVPRFS